jgi:hypothetical protein
MPSADDVAGDCEFPHGHDASHLYPPFARDLRFASYPRPTLWT